MELNNFLEEQKKMANVIFKNVSKRFGDFEAVKNLNLEVNDHEFLCLVGPSGCGKTTSLRMLAGLDDISSGTISIGDQIVNEVIPKERDIAMVFQSYALYPHYTVYENLAFGLRTRQQSFFERIIIKIAILLFYALIIGILYGISALINDFLPDSLYSFLIAAIIGILTLFFLFPEIPRAIRSRLLSFLAEFIAPIKNYLAREVEIEKRVLETAHLLGIEKQLKKKPKQLSGGQRQRVALGRAIIRNPKVFLMDEPLSNLDAKLRVQMRAELQRLTKRLQITSIYVTHDQIEAMTLGHRIAILNEGVLQQIGTPDEVYKLPVNKFVAGFIGSPSMNFIQGTIQKNQSQLIFHTSAFDYNIPHHYQPALMDFLENEVILGVRPEHIKLSSTSADSAEKDALIGVIEPIGSDTYIYIDYNDETTFIVKEEGISHLQIDDNVKVTFLDDQIHFFAIDTQKRIIPE